MTPKEKAKELYDKFSITTGGSNGFKIGFKSHALIAVDEILNDDWYIATAEDSIERKKYWQEVKQEIQIL